MAVYAIQKYQCSGLWNKPIVIFSPVPMDQYTFRAKVNTATNLGIGDICEFIQAAGDETDVLMVTTSVVSSLVATCFVPDTEWNRFILARDASVETYSGLTRGTAQFAVNSLIDVCFLVPGMILALKLINSTAIIHGEDIKCGGTGKVTLWATAGKKIGVSLAKATSVAALQYIPVLIGGGVN